MAGVSTTVVPERAGAVLYINDGRLWAIEVQTEPSLKLGNPVALFETARWTGQFGVAPNYDVAPDGQRFVFRQPVKRSLARQSNVVLNWFEEHRERVPVIAVGRDSSE